MNRSVPIKKVNQPITKDKLFLSMSLSPSNSYQPFDQQIDRCLRSPGALKNIIMDNPFFKAQMEAKMQNEAQRPKDLYEEINKSNQLEEYQHQLDNFSGLSLDTRSLSYNIMHKQRNQRKKSQEIKKIIGNFENFI